MRLYYLQHTRKRACSSRSHKSGGIHQQLLQENNEAHEQAEHISPNFPHHLYPDINQQPPEDTTSFSLELPQPSTVFYYTELGCCIGVPYKAIIQCVIHFEGKIFTLPCKIKDEVRTLKDKIHDKEGIPHKEQRLLTGTKQMFDYEKLEAYLLTHSYESYIHITLKLRLVGAGSSPKKRPASLADIFSTPRKRRRFQTPLEKAMQQSLKTQRNLEMNQLCKESVAEALEDVNFTWTESLIQRSCELYPSLQLGKDVWSNLWLLRAHVRILQDNTVFSSRFSVGDEVTVCWDANAGEFYSGIVEEILSASEMKVQWDGEKASNHNPNCLLWVLL